jgi:hypothetical protein
LIRRKINFVARRQAVPVVRLAADMSANELATEYADDGDRHFYAQASQSRCPTELPAAGGSYARFTNGV